MKLKYIINDNKDDYKIFGDQNIDIKKLTHRHDDVEEATLFFCIKGDSFDGNDFIEKVIVAGAICVVTENKEIAKKYCDKVVVVLVEDVRICMSKFSKIFYDSACDKMKIVGVVGTNGKTTTCYIIKQIIKQKGLKVALIGTNGVIVDGKNISTNMTTPDPITLHYIFKQLYNLKVDVVVMEISAHAIYYNKVYGVMCEVLAYTNISNEHLDFFKTMEAYSSVKINYFNSKNCKNIVLNIDDDYGLKILQCSDVPCLTYGLKNPSTTFAIDIKMSIKGSSFVVNANDNIFEVKNCLVGVYNVYNILSAINVGLIFGCSVEDIIYALNTLKPIDGRFNVYKLDCNNIVVIDYAHTPDGFENVLSIIRKIRKGRVITVFGCVGYSDSIKRLQMGKIAGLHSTELVLTSDNPNYIKIKEINADILLGIDADYLKNVKQIDDRSMAVEYAFLKMMENDTLVLLGKGAETSNKICGVNHVYSDIKCIESLIEKYYNVKKSDISCDEKE